MKYTALLLVATLFTACSQDTKVTKLDNQKDKVSYSIGLDIGKNLKSQAIEINNAAFLQGLKDGVAGDSTLLTEAQVQEVMTAFQQELTAKQQEKAKKQGEENKKIGDKFLAENKTKSGVVTMPSGLQYKVIKEGTGVMPKATDMVTVHYRGTTIDGKEFDSSIKRGQPATFPVNGVISGWTEALQLMKVGSKWELYIPSALAYGERGAGHDIGPNSVLIFEVELLEAKPAQ